MVSKFDETMMYLRKSNNTYGGATGQLSCCLTVHVDDLGATGEAATLSWLQGELESRYGALTVQENQFLHVGYEYTQHADGSCDAVSYTHLTLPTICSV